MGRKIPGKKHRSIKYPHVQKQHREDSLKNKINNPVKNVDEQEVPKSVLRIMHLKKLTKKGHFDNKWKRKWSRKKKDEPFSIEKAMGKETIQPWMKVPDRDIPNLVQKPNESPSKFVRRVSKMAHEVVQEAQFEDQYNVEIQKDPTTGKVLNVRKLAKIRTSKKKSLREKKKEKKLSKNALSQDGKDFNDFKDEVKFGEVVHHPPTNLPKLRGQKESAKKPGIKNDLLLKNLIGETKTKNNLTNLEKQKAELDRQFIVEAYRKKKKQLNCVI